MVSLLKTARHPFIICFAIIGLMFVFITPPAQAPDEMPHFYRAYQVGDGDVFPVQADGRFGGLVDTGIMSYATTTKQQAINANYNFIDNVTPSGSFSHKEDFAAFDNTVVYSPLLYIPTAVAIDFAKVLNISASSTFYLARLFNFLACLIIVILSFHLLKRRLNVGAFILLLPTSFFLMGSLSQDALLITLSFLVISSLIALKENPQSRPIWIALFVSLFLLVTGKLPYLPLILLLGTPLLWLSRRTIKKYVVIIGAVIVFTLLYAIWWYLRVRNIPIEVIMADRTLAATVDSHSQLQHILHAPLDYAYTLFRTNFTGDANRAVHEFFGMYGYAGGGPFLAPTFYIVMWLISAVALFGSKIKTFSVFVIKSNKRLILLALLALAGSLFLVQTTLYLQWTSVGEHTIMGLQGRYYIPLAIIAGGLLSLLSKKVSDLSFGYKPVVLVSLVITVPSLILMFITYYK